MKTEGPARSWASGAEDHAAQLIAEALDVFPRVALRQLLAGSRIGKRYGVFGEQSAVRDVFP